MKKSNFFVRLLNRLSGNSSSANSANNENSSSANSSAKTISVFSFDEIGTIQHWQLCKQVVSAYNSRNNKENNGYCAYSLQDVEKAKNMLSTFRKNHKTENDRFLCIRNQQNAKTDTATAVAKTATAHTSSIQGDIKGNALSALNWAIKKYNSAQIVTIGEIKKAFEALQDVEIYRYYSVSTMQFNAKALLAKCVNNAINAKVKAAKQAAKIEK